MLTPKEAEDIAAKKLLKGYVYDTRPKYYNLVSLDKKYMETKNRHMLNEFLHKASEARLKLKDIDIIKIPFDFFVENENSSYFVEVKTSKSKDYAFGETQTIGLIAAKKLKIPIYFLWFHLQNVNFNKFIPKFELWEIVDFKIRQIRGMKKFKVNINDHRCNNEIYDLVINKEFHDCIVCW